MSTQPNNPLHGVKLQYIVEFLEQKFGWVSLGSQIPLRCFLHEPSVSSSLKFLRKTPWAREKVENLFLKTLSDQHST
ncbi:MAG: VF530 family protein [Schleiferiaceae bacterium]|nr:VF530 family protein [Schleiferiaceae bacterium]